MPKVPEPDLAATFVDAKKKNGPKPGSMFNFFAPSGSATRYSEKWELEASVVL